MNGEYQIYKRDPVTGRKAALIQRYKSFTLTLNWGEASKFSIKGETVDDVDLDCGDYILFYRNNELIFSGVAEELSIDCDNPSVGKKEWTASGRDDNIIFAHRLNVPDNTEMTFLEKYTDKIKDFAFNRILHYIKMNMVMPPLPDAEQNEEEEEDSEHASADRGIEGLVVPGKRSWGKEDLSSYRYKLLSEIFKEIGQEENGDDENGLYPVFHWNPETGVRSIEIPQKRDMTASVVLSPEFGNVTSWSRSSKMPKFNALWIVSGSYTDKDAEADEDGKKPTTRIWQYHGDEDSIARFGRIEKVVTKSDVKVIYDDEKTEDEDESVTVEEVNRLLNIEAIKQLKDNAFQSRYTITMAETPELQFWRDWKCGDLVTCVINGEKFVSTIKTVSINYSKGKETVKPTVGGVDKGEFSDIFSRISGIDTRLEEKELEEEQ